MLDDVDVNRLSAEEALEFKRLQTADIAVLLKRKYPVFGRTWIALGIWAGLTLGGLVLVLDIPKSFIGLAIAIWLVVMVGGIVGVGMETGKASRARRQKLIGDFLMRIEYATRPPRQNTGAGGTHDDLSLYEYKRTWATGNYDPKRYFSYSKSELEYMKMTGMDADTYDSNMPD